LASPQEPRPVLRSVQSWEDAPVTEDAPVNPPPPRPAATSGVERRDGSGLSAYLHDVRRHPLMSREEEHVIALRFVETGDERLAQRLVAANLRLVIKIALEYRSSRRHLTDLVQEGNVGLIHAVHKYDPHRGVRFATYSSWWIRAYMLKFMLSNARLVKLGTTQAQRRLFFGLRRERARLEGQSGATVETRQLASALDVSEEEVVDMERRLSSSDASLDRPARDGDAERSRGDSLSADVALGPDVQTEEHELAAIVRGEVATFRQTLAGRDVTIFNGRLASEHPTTLAEIADQFGVSRERVRQLEERLKRRLRIHLRAKLGDAVPAEASATVS